MNPQDFILNYHRLIKFKHGKVKRFSEESQSEKPGVRSREGEVESGGKESQATHHSEPSFPCFEGHQSL
jgi:hypothetical protein